MMRPVLALIAAALLSAPLVAGLPNAQTGQQNGGAWGPSTPVVVQGGTLFILFGLVGDHDIFFFDARGQPVGEAIDCGHDEGTVPDTAVTALVRQWDAVGEILPCVTETPGPSSFVYVDGIAAEG